MKFLYHSASFGVFLILLICSSIELSSIKDREKLRGPSPTELEWLICIWVMGKLSAVRDSIKPCSSFTNA